MKKKGTKMKGTVKCVLSGDRIVLYGPKGKDGLHFEKTVQLVCVRAGRMGYIGERKHEGHALEQRDYLRKKLVGKEVEFYIEDKLQGGVDLASVYFQGVELSQQVLGLGHGTCQNRKECSNLEVYRQSEQ